MAKQSKRPEQRPATVRQGPGNVIFAGVICLAIGLLVGYYFGKQQTHEAAAPAAASGPPVQSAPLSNPSVLVQEEAALQASLRANPNDVSTLIRLGNLYYDHARWTDAVDAYGRALAIDSKNVNVRTDRGTSYWNLGQPDAAIGEFKKSLEVDPSHAQTLYNLGVVYLHGKNDPVEARKSWERLLSLHPNYPERAKLEQQLAELAQPSAPSGAPAGDNMQNLLERLQSRPPKN
jgi:cytochrome c-type biogenesis protein CcmH/NrfG